MNKKFDFTEGELLLIDKPYTWTSFDVVKKIRNALKIKKIGHAGTLDPLATGLLILCTGKMTKKIDIYQAAEKEYTGQLVIGKTTPSVDLETDFDSEYDISHINNEIIAKNTEKFKGQIQQVPPIFSAVKVDGERSYKKARKGKAVEIKPRTIFIKEFKITDINLPVLSFKVICSKGTYIRSLVKDYGEALGTGAYLTTLRRTRIGDYHVTDAFELEHFITSVKQQAL